MEQYKQEFIEFMVDCQVLKFGDFTLKSGRKSPFFMNAGAYVTGSQLMRLGEYYATRSLRWIPSWQRTWASIRCGPPSISTLTIPASC